MKAVMMTETENWKGAPYTYFFKESPSPATSFPKLWSLIYGILIIHVSIPDKKEKINLNFYFHTSLWCLKRFHESLSIQLSEIYRTRRVNIYIYIYAILIAIEIHDHRNRWEATNCQVYQARYMKKCQNLKFDDKTLDC